MQLLMLVNIKTELPERKVYFRSLIQADFKHFLSFFFLTFQDPLCISFSYSVDQTNRSQRTEDLFWKDHVNHISVYLKLYSYVLESLSKSPSIFLKKKKKKSG